VLIYWHVERKSMAVHSQLISCSASEVAAMVEGAGSRIAALNRSTAQWRDTRGLAGQFRRAQHAIKGAGHVPVSH
jgi:TnpA family transposase